MGILNVTPDSFSDGGLAFDVPHAVARFETLVNDGADIVDIGAESTRPGATALTPAEEWSRLAPVLSALCVYPLRRNSVISIDTRHAETARAALAMGVEIINDVGGLRDAAMRQVLAQSACRIVVMHALSIPADTSVVLPPNADPIAIVLQWKTEVITLAHTDGIATERLIFDPGIGFGKTAEQSLGLMDRANELLASGGEWLYGHSRKSCYRILAENNVDNSMFRDTMTLKYSSKLADVNVNYLRVHDIAAHRALLG